jgi:pimeloyl-ACP methyl ester carboxylesterase
LAAVAALAYGIGLLSGDPGVSPAPAEASPSPSSPASSATKPTETGEPSAAASEPGEVPPPSNAELADGTLVDVGGHRLFIRCVGEGGPTVVASPGAGDTAQVWRPVQRRLSSTVRVCAYSRAGQGRSEAADESQRTLTDSATDLHTLLDRAGVDGEMIVAGHSLGGLISRLYADRYPQQTQALMLVDAPVPNIDERLDPLLSEAASDAVLSMLRSVEGFDIVDSQSQLVEAGSLGDRPVVVITAGDLAIPPFVSEDLVAELQAAWEDSQTAWLEPSTNARRVIAEDSGHAVHRDNPALVTRQLRRLVDQVGGYQAGG